MICNVTQEVDNANWIVGKWRERPHDSIIKEQSQSVVASTCNNVVYISVECCHCTRDGRTHSKVMVARSCAVNDTSRMGLNMPSLQWTAVVICILIMLDEVNIKNTQ